MIFPDLIKKEFCKTPIKVFLNSEEINEDGNPVNYEFQGVCNYQGSSKAIFEDGKKTVQLTGKCLFIGDIFPGLDTIGEGEVELFDSGIRRKIYRGCKNYNPDGTVNFTTLELM
jgi:hypothetical protein